MRKDGTAMRNHLTKDQKGDWLLLMFYSLAPNIVYMTSIEVYGQS